MKLNYCILADTIVRNVDGKLIIIGVFGGIACKSFPAVHPRLSMAIQIDGGIDDVGEHELEINFVDADYKALGKPMKAPIHLNEAMGKIASTSDFNVNVENLVIPKPGLYELTIKVDNRHIGSASLSVHTIKRSKK